MSYFLVSLHGSHATVVNNYSVIVRTSVSLLLRQMWNGSHFLKRFVYSAVYTYTVWVGW